jgi:transcriptional regulator with XRE-family HTH domain
VAKPEVRAGTNNGDVAPSDDLALGRQFRAVRVRRGLRQREVVEKSGLSPSRISAIETGRLDGVTLGALRSAGRALRLRVRVSFILARGDLGQLRDAAHAALVDATARLLRASGWEVAAEVEFSGGSVDVLAWHAASRTLLVVEVKPRLDDLGATLRQLGRYERVAPTLARRWDWEPRIAGRLLIVAVGRTNRRVLETHGPTVASALPARGAEVRRWLRRPNGRLDGVLALPLPDRVAGAVRVRRCSGPRSRTAPSSARNCR